MVEVAVKPAATNKSQESWGVLNLNLEQSRERSDGKPVASRNSANQRILKLEAENWPHNFHILQQQYLTWRKSIRSYERFMAEVQRMT